MLKITGEKEFKERYNEQKKEWNAKKKIARKVMLYSSLSLTVINVLCFILCRMLDNILPNGMFSWVFCCTLTIWAIGNISVLSYAESKRPMRPAILDLVILNNKSNNNSRLMFDGNDSSNAYIYYCYVDRNGIFKEMHVNCTVDHTRTSGEDDVSVAFPDENGNVTVVLADNSLMQRVNWSVIGDMITMTADEVVEKYC